MRSIEQNWAKRMLQSVIVIMVVCFMAVLCENLRDNFAEKKKKEELFDKLKENLSDSCPGIICWGDSLTVGVGGNGTNYPDVLEQLIREKLMPEILIDYTMIKVVNMGVGGEDTNTILGRNGAVPFVVSKDFVIPADKEPVPVTFCSANGKTVAPLRQANTGMESVEICGVLGEITIIQESYISSEYSYTFSRQDDGECVEVTAGTPIITSGLR